MIPKYLSATWAALAPALGNHLWQSTLFVAIAALLTLTLRKNHARTRYWLWLTASVKFLIPFSLLVGMGSNLGWLRVWVGTKASLYSTMEEVSHPLTPPTISVISGGTPFAASDNWTRLLPVLLIALWLYGFVVVLIGVGHALAADLRGHATSATATRRTRNRSPTTAGASRNWSTAPANRDAPIPRLSGARDLRDRPAGIAMAARNLPTPRRHPPRSDTRARTVARPPSRQSGRGAAYAS